MLFRKKKNVHFDEVLFESVAISSHTRNKMEGRLELPLQKRNVYIIGVLFLLIAGWFLFKLFNLQVMQGASFYEQSVNNQLSADVIIAERGVIYDRFGKLLAWNEQDHEDEYDFPIRSYTDDLGLGQMLGYVTYPLKDKAGFYYRTEYVGVSGVESVYNDVLAGNNGQRLVEVDASGKMISEHEVDKPEPGEDITLSIDSALSAAMYDIIATSSEKAGFRSGAGIIIDVKTGEIIALTSYPSYDPEVMADGDDVELIQTYNTDERFPFLNKTLATYVPGSIVKPFVAYGALAEDIISPNKTIVSNGRIVIPNPYTPSQPSIFNDWRAHGAMTMREAIAFSSNVYFYIIGGGFEGQPGLGITKMHEYFTKFGIGGLTGVELANEQAGNVPNPAWKREVFDDDWRLGDTYFTAIGQYGFLASPIQMVRAYAALANGGTLVTPTLLKGEQGETVDLQLNPSHLSIIHEGMRKTVIMDGGTARGLEKKYVEIAAKSGTAELGLDNAYVNSWAAGFWPYEEPKYAFVLLMEHVSRENRLGATTIMGQVIEWMHENEPEKYFKKINEQP